MKEVVSVVPIFIHKKMRLDQLNQEIEFIPVGTKGHIIKENQKTLDVWFDLDPDGFGEDVKVRISRSSVR
jgi:hypothetical protein